MKLSIPFLGTDIAQLPPPNLYGNEAVEAVIFNRKDLESTAWEAVWKHIKHAVSLYGCENVTFHFPVNDSEYCRDQFVKLRLQEGLDRASALGLHGVVVHSNQIGLLPWVNSDLEAKRKQVIDTLATIREKIKSNTWLALENMPVMDNHAIEIDPLFVFPDDFINLRDTSVKVVWDVCHYTNSLANIHQLLDGRQQSKYYPNVQKTEYLDFVKIKDIIAHWHFSAFLGIANPDTEERCREGIMPAESTLGEEIYASIAQTIFSLQDKNSHMVFEIQEDNYSHRIHTRKTIEWIKSFTL